MSSDNVETLANAIVIQAVDDYIEAINKKKDAEEMLIQAEKVLNDCESFFHGSWYKELTAVNPDTIIKVAIIQAEYLRWQKKKGCAKCKKDECIHKKKKVNWKEWSDGNKTCIRKEK